MQEVLQEERSEKAYEVSFLAETEEKIEDVKRLVGQHGATVSSISMPKKINLAYPINHLTQAVFMALKITAAPEKIKMLEKDLRGNKNVVRSLIVTLPREKEEEVKDEKKYGVSMRRGVSREPHVEKTKPLSNEAIEKKIEEILQ